MPHNCRSSLPYTGPTPTHSKYRSHSDTPRGPSSHCAVSVSVHSQTPRIDQCTCELKKGEWMNISNMEQKKRWQAILLILILLVFRYKRCQELHSKIFRRVPVLLRMGLSFRRVVFNMRLILVPLLPFRWRTRPYPLAYTLHNAGS